MTDTQHFDVLVVGGGHAGTEAAAAAARMGAKTVLLTNKVDDIGQMSCNPAIGGIGKSHLVAEIDALDGVMGRATDKAGIHYRVLNKSKGPAVRALRVQTDRKLYRKAVQEILQEHENLVIRQESVMEILTEGKKAIGCSVNSGRAYFAGAVILTAGTFLAGKIHIGDLQSSGGRVGEPASSALAESMRGMTFRVGRLKTGTPPRLKSDSINFEILEEQHSDDLAPPMSARSKREERPLQIACFITHTNVDTHKIIEDNILSSAMYSGAIEGVGPRYCPSIEDKIKRFAERDKHQIFLEPEGLESDLIYPNGISTSLPLDVQKQFVHSIRGLDKAIICQGGYAIEYDYFDPRDLNYSLETKEVQNLFFAGQINGTTGYEEAAAQGIVAGINAVRLVRGLDPWEPARDSSYLGVMIDDLTHLGTKEPYRMFTSRAEYRLQLRQDNADQRLTNRGIDLGVVGSRRAQLYREKMKTQRELADRLAREVIFPNSGIAKMLGLELSREFKLRDLFRRPELDVLKVADALGMNKTDAKVVSALETIETEIKYEGYINRQKLEIQKIRKSESEALPSDLNYDGIEGLSSELKQKLVHFRPKSLDRASRIPGMTPAALSILLVHAKRASAE